MAAVYIEGKIFAILMAHLTGFTSYPIVYPNTVYPIAGMPREATFFVVSHTPNSPVGFSIDPMDEYQFRGVLGISVMTPLQNGGQDPQDVAGALARHYTAAVLRDDPVVLRVVARPHVVGGYIDGSHWRTPVVIMYETIAAPNESIG
jgi:hypothetical protein